MEKKKFHIANHCDCVQAQPECALGNQLHVHRLCPHHNVVQRYQVEEKDSLDEHLDVLTRKLAEKVRLPNFP